MARIVYLGHSAFYIEGKSHRVLLDPFITSNPSAQAAGLKASQFNPHGIVISHGHFDHFEDALDIARRTQATVVATFELANYLQAQGAPQTFGMNPGGPCAFPFGKVRLTKAYHSSSHEGTYLGAPCGIVLTTDDGLTIYHAGDTELFGDMALIGALDKPKVALLPLGSVFTMDPTQALEAVKLIKPQIVIPMHYNTWPPIAQDAQAFRRRVEAETSARVVVLSAGQSWSS